MEPQLFCQSCTMPIDDPALRGTEKTGEKSELYCKYCYSNGEFTNPSMTLAEMENICKEQMKKQNIPAHILELSLKMLPNLKRWKK